MSSSKPILTVKLSGAEIKEGRIPVDELTHVLKGLQLSVKRLAQVMSGRTSNIRQGRTNAAIEAACRLDVVAFEPGSFVVALDTSSSERAQQSLFSPSFGGEVARSLVEGVMQIGQEQSTVPDIFDPGVLFALEDITEVIGHGVDTLELGYMGGDGPLLKGLIDNRVRTRISDTLNRTFNQEREISGLLQEVNLFRRTCRVSLQNNSIVSCKFGRELEPSIVPALSRNIEAWGRATMIVGRQQVIKEMRLDRINIVDLPTRPDHPRTDAMRMDLPEGSNIVGGKPGRHTFVKLAAGRMKTQLPPPTDEEVDQRMTEYWAEKYK